MLALFASSALSFNVATSNLLSLRGGGGGVAPSNLLSLRGGGVSNDQLVDAMAGLYIVVGLQGWLAPKKTMEMYGPKELSPNEVSMLRILSSYQVASGITMLADSKAAASVGFISWALATCANVPAIEQGGTSAKGAIGFIPVLGALGELTRQGKLDAALSGKILNFMLISAVGEVIAQQKTLEAFDMPNASPLAKSLFENFSFTKISTGLFLLVSKVTGKRGLGLAAANGATVLNVVKTLARADKVGLQKPGLIFWGVLQSAIAAVAFKKA
jgi:hypothetical protein